MRLRLTLPICMLVAGFLAMVAVGPAAVQANSALDQYVEEVPDTQGNPNEFEQPKDNTLDPQVKKQLDSHGQEGQELGQVAAATAPAVAPTVTSEKTKSKKSKPEQKDRLDSSKQDELEKMIDKGPGTSKALGAAADASGINGPLAAFVALVAAGMVAYSVRRRRSEG